MKSKPIVIIEEDKEDLQSIKDAFAQLKVENEIIVFDDCRKFIDFIRETEGGACFTLCDVNTAKKRGSELKKLISGDERLRLKCVPFIFMSTSGVSNEVMKAYSYGVEGFFLKPSNFEELKELLHSVIILFSQSNIF